MWQTLDKGFPRNKLFTLWDGRSRQSCIGGGLEARTTHKKFWSFSFGSP
ncbi:hypothetical protein [Scytonema sp. NUACC21]